MTLSLLVLGYLRSLRAGVGDDLSTSGGITDGSFGGTGNDSFDFTGGTNKASGTWIPEQVLTRCSWVQVQTPSP